MLPSEPLEESCWPANAPGEGRSRELGMRMELPEDEDEDEDVGFRQLKKRETCIK